MEALNSETSNILIKAQMKEASKKSIKANQICPIQLLEKELDVEHGTTHYNKHESHQISVQSNNVFLPNKDAKKTVDTVVHIRPVLTLRTFLQTVELVGEDAVLFSVKKVKGLFGSKFQIIDNANPNNVFELTSNFIGSRYHLTKDKVTYLTVSFRVGCGNLCRQLDIYTLRDRSHWDSLEGFGTSCDLEELYSKGNNYEHISRYTNMEPSVSTRTGEATLRFSRRSIVPCVQNMIVCNLNGQKVMELMKINDFDNLFEVCMQRKMDTEKLLAILIATFDFKLGLE